jgi:hypothetical protein
MLDAIAIGVYQMQHLSETPVEIQVGIVVFWSIKFLKLLNG